MPIRDGGLGLTSSAAIKGAGYIGFQALVLRRIIAASFRENPSSLLEGLPERPMASVPLDELKILATKVEGSKIEDIGASWAALAAGEDSLERRIGTLLIEVGAK